MTSSSTQGRSASRHHHSHSVSLGNINTSYRVTRRKSTNAAAALNTPAAIRAALHDQAVKSTPNLTRTRNGGKHESATPTSLALSGSAIAEDDNFASSSLPALSAQLSSRTRRASEGAHLASSSAKGEGNGKRSSAELKCEKCGKGYKHSSCLYKHLWEHDPAWAYTSKLLISKHQQVQLLEAASVLVNMNQDSPTSTSDSELVPRTADAIDSDVSTSPSPAASGSSDTRDYEYDDEDRDDDDDDRLLDRFSSAETTPPPTSDFLSAHNLSKGLSTGGRGSSRHSHVGGSGNKRSSGLGSSYSRSYQSSSLPLNSKDNTEGGFAAYYAQSLQHGLPTVSADEEDESTLAAAVETLCSFGTPRSGPVVFPSASAEGSAGYADDEIPPVPPLPAQYNPASLSSSFQPLDSLLHTRGAAASGANMDGAASSANVMGGLTSVGESGLQGRVSDFDLLPSPSYHQPLSNERGRGQGDDVAMSGTPNEQHSLHSPVASGGAASGAARGGGAVKEEATHATHATGSGSGLASPVEDEGVFGSMEGMDLAS